ncbi:MAG: DUF2147 domain-containing protein [Bacteroidetes bacterium]|jgi:uncharacterized protein (DUF2147 family)|nr:DUF2147 domain-containing protein [Bacteroidota bacterium]MBP9136718.1 DUF2147 domain-containing protein [Chitinophagales bacterium]MBK7506101.1 DUF2147 domain-containing protein [Bacteroidota bacterium]MBK9355584.1 DUF2147 domain-containing protein [Bacteroidota bacterium]MBK9634060.1 DUF2147 domain-containing protein [Bacteroidota bacterium]
MKKLFFIAVSFFVSLSTFAGEGITGIWKTVDDETGKEKSYLEIYEKNGVFYAKINKLLLAEDQGKVCDKCTGDKLNKPVLGLEVMWGIKKKDATHWEGGKIMDPKNGKIYDCKIELLPDGRLKVRGYVGISMLGRTQYWTKK